MALLTMNSLMTEMYSVHHIWLQNWLRRRLASGDMASDLTQDTFLSILKNPVEKLAEIEEPRAYLLTVAKCILANYYQRQSLEAAYLEVMSQMSETEVISPEEKLILLQSLQEIDAMLATLPVKVRQAFLLLHLEGCRYAEIASRLKVSERSVKRYIAQAFEQCLLQME